MDTSGNIKLADFGASKELRVSNHLSIHACACGV